MILRLDHRQRVLVLSHVLHPPVVTGVTGVQQRQAPGALVAFYLSRFSWSNTFVLGPARHGSSCNCFRQ